MESTYPVTLAAHRSLVLEEQGDVVEHFQIRDVACVVIDLEELFTRQLFHAFVKPVSSDGLLQWLVLVLLENVPVSLDDQDRVGVRLFLRESDDRKVVSLFLDSSYQLVALGEVVQVTALLFGDLRQVRQLHNSVEIAFGHSKLDVIERVHLGHVASQEDIVAVFGGDVAACTARRVDHVSARHNCKLKYIG